MAGFTSFCLGKPGGQSGRPIDFMEINKMPCIDILYSIWTEPIQRKPYFAGLFVVTLPYQPGSYLHASQKLDAWIRDRCANGVVFVREFARGPSGSFDTTLEKHPELFRDAHFLLGGQPDNLPGETWVPPVESSRLISDNGSFITLEFIEKWIEGLTP